MLLEGHRIEMEQNAPLKHVKVVSKMSVDYYYTFNDINLAQAHPCRKKKSISVLQECYEIKDVCDFKSPAQRVSAIKSWALHFKRCFVNVS